MESTKTNQITPDKIMQIGMGFWASKTLLTAVNMSLFTHLANNQMSGNGIKEKLGLNERSLYDFLDTLVALGFLERTGLKENAIYTRGTCGCSCCNCCIYTKYFFYSTNLKFDFFTEIIFDFTTNISTNSKL